MMVGAPRPACVIPGALACISPVIESTEAMVVSRDHQGAVRGATSWVHSKLVSTSRRVTVSPTARLGVCGETNARGRMQSLMIGLGDEHAEAARRESERRASFGMCPGRAVRSVKKPH